MRRRLGHLRYHRTESGVRAIVEIALNIDLLTEGSERQLRDTLLHEMAHAEAWLVHGERGHGPQWRRIARRLGCVPRACTTTPVPLRPVGSAPTRRVPPRYLI
jgi:predicted SprT family Zn-dependent metalloprotease